MGAISSADSDYTAIALVVDRSGSMASIEKDTKGGVKSFIASQKQNPGKATLTLVQFDHQYEVLHDFASLSDVNENAFADQYRPRGSTALLDAFGKTILQMGETIEKMVSSKRPSRVIIAVVTDGEENSSTEFQSVEKVKALVEAKQKLGWDFIYLGADLKGFNAAKSYGLDTGTVVHFDSSKMSEALKSVDEKVSAVRQGKGKEALVYSEEERNSLEKSKLVSP